jgi:hypothetical protein
MSTETLYFDLSEKIHIPEIATNDIIPYRANKSKLEKQINDIHTYTLLIEALGKNTLQMSNESRFYDIARINEIWESCRTQVKLLANTYCGNSHVKYVGVNPKVQKKLILALLMLFEDEK